MPPALARRQASSTPMEVSQRSGQGLPCGRPARVGAYFASEGVTRYGDRPVLLKGLLLVAVTVGLNALILIHKPDDAVRFV